MLKKEQIHLRDPFIFPECQTKTYYLFGTTDGNVWSGRAEGFDYYTSTDLQNWDGPFPAFRPDQSFWADRQFWAPEVHKYQAEYYMLASFKAENRCRGTQILKAKHPSGPYHSITNGPVTPGQWECLDGTLYVDADGHPWLIFCWEWLQVQDGKICAQKLTDDLKQPIAEPIVLFRASEAKWTKPAKRSESVYVTDGPFLYHQGNKLSMIWSSMAEHGYAIGVSHSLSGNVAGPWQHDDAVLIERDGGHGMIFQTFEGEWLLTFHAPNQTPKERPVFIKL
ncbi:glycoside hydrolase family 43 protein [Amphibacillus jilinensis]|uniref:glycoside hydrolase family 43 protein n=1 Tax=Amphibacillus jilinensis TaxID=1216008 RepID=UPI0002DE4105|nr:glycoside hydrolase family 43 protein [Amphibacillus jilinensis]